MKVYNKSFKSMKKFFITFFCITLTICACICLEQTLRVSANQDEYRTFSIDSLGEGTLVNFFNLQNVNYYSDEEIALDSSLADEKVMTKQIEYYKQADSISDTHAVLFTVYTFHENTKIDIKNQLIFDSLIESYIEDGTEGIIIRGTLDDEGDNTLIFRCNTNVFGTTNYEYYDSYNIVIKDSPCSMQFRYINFEEGENNNLGIISNVTMQKLGKHLSFRDVKVDNYKINKTLMLNYGGYFYVEDMIFTNNEGNNLILNSDFGIMSVVESYFESNNNLAQSIDGGIINSRNAASTANFLMLAVDNCKFYNNTANDGGAIHINKSEAYITRNIFEGNNTRSRGGAICIKGDNTIGENYIVRIEDCEFTNNSTQGIDKTNNYGYGGAIAINDKYIPVYIEKCDFNKNHATIRGGAICGQRETHIYNCNFEENTCDLIGGAIFAGLRADVPEMNVRDSKLKNNSAKFGGGIAAYTSGIETIVNLENVQMENNTAEFGGAFIGCTKTKLTITGDTFIPVNEDNSNDILIFNMEPFESSGINLYKDNHLISFYDDLGSVLNPNMLQEKERKFGISLINSYPGMKIAQFKNRYEESDIEFFEFIEIDENGNRTKTKDKATLRENGNYTDVILSKDISFLEQFNLDDQEYDYSNLNKEYEIDLAKNYSLTDYNYCLGKYAMSNTLSDSNIVTVTYPFFNDVNVTYKNNSSAGVASVIMMPKDEKYCGSISRLDFLIICDLSQDTNVVAMPKVEALVRDIDYNTIIDERMYTIYAGGRIVEIDEECMLTNLPENIVGNENEIVVSVQACSNALYYKNVANNIRFKLKPIIIYSQEDNINDTYVQVDEIEQKVKVDLYEISASDARVVKIGINIENTTQTSIQKDIIKEDNPKTKEIGTYEIDIERYDDDSLVSGKYDLIDEIYLNLTVPLSKEYEYEDFVIYHGIDTNNDGLEDDIEKIYPTHEKIKKDVAELGFFTKSFSTFSVYAKATKKEAPLSSSSNSNFSNNVTVSIVNIEHESIIEGYEDGTFKPNSNITREEVATIISRLDENYNKNVDYTQYITNANIKDVELNRWSANAIGYMIKRGIMSETSKSIFNPKKNCTRGEIAKIICSYKNIVADGLVSSYSDANGKWYDKYVAALSNNKYIEGYGDGTFKGQNSLTRAEFCKLIVLMENRNIENMSRITYSMKTSILNKFLDIKETNWYFPYVFELTYEHSKELVH